MTLRTSTTSKPSTNTSQVSQMPQTQLMPPTPQTPQTPNLIRIFNSVSNAIDCTTHALSSVPNIRFVAGMTPPDSSRMPNPIDEFVYTEQMLTELLHHLQSARKQLFLLGVDLAKENSQKVSSE